MRQPLRVPVNRAPGWAHSAYVHLEPQGRVPRCPWGSDGKKAVPRAGVTVEIHSLHVECGEGARCPAVGALSMSKAGGCHVFVPNGGEG